MLTLLNAHLNLGSWFIGTGILYCALIVYRLWFHPLSRFPGSKLAAASKWYEFYFDFCKYPTGQFRNEIERMHQEYGPIVRINPEEIHIKDHAFHDVLYAPGAKRDKYYNAAKMVGIPEASFGTVDHDLHKARRAPNMILFSRRAVEGRMQELIHQEAEALSEQFKLMRQDHSETRNVRAMFLGYASAFASNYFIGTRLDYQENRESLDRWFRTIVAIPKDTVVVKQFPWLTEFGMMLPRAISTLMVPPLAGVLALHDLCREQASLFLQRRRQDPDSDRADASKFEIPDSIFDAIMSSNLAPDQKTYGRLWQEAFNLFFASVDTTSRTLAWATYYLISNRSFHQLLQRELDNAIPHPADMPELRTLENLPLLTATIKETVRCMQLISGRIPVTCPETLTFENWVIPARTPISMSPNDTLIDPVIYPEPHVFNPLRWLDYGSDGKTLVLHTRLNQYWHPFGRGPRQCQGMSMAWIIIYYGLAIVHRRFELVFADDFDAARDAEIVSEHFFGDPSAESRSIRVRVQQNRD